MTNPTAASITAAAIAVVAAANELKKAYHLAKEITAYNSVNDPGWATLATDVDANGIISGTNANHTDISAAIGSLNNFISFWEGTSPWPAQSAWGQNIEKIATPLVS